jgi:hypothetical protein
LSLRKPTGGFCHVFLWPFSDNSFSWQLCFFFEGILAALLGARSLPELLMLLGPSCSISPHWPHDQPPTHQLHIEVLPRVTASPTHLRLKPAQPKLILLFFINTGFP